ncbi:hypothetical protein PPL_07219 [Heterostelium album PN500]|uniref:Ankyrin repeat protein n=1 Tax=Heterostelium pallidum (strain ATCC 26659 / Pp 5 / PN500) TaxID=670386 RepID=D3BEQ4_HETP5|nr:hypothetical protein PPL_07219 [Heterostelium album PN500]EFA80385.1 hypothetical protein PPL_07219 [Heterostelium album PN500]|eukprot:XP_020432505.1 hypothetical protein PPL_07219 [Heterostelium album PN500]
MNKELFLKSISMKLQSTSIRLSRISHQLAIHWELSSGYINALKNSPIQMFNQPSLCTHSAISRAARANNLEMVKWIHENGVKGSPREAIDYACENNNIEMVKRLNENRTEGASFVSIVHSIANNNFEMFQYLLENVFNRIIHDDRDESFIFYCSNTSQEAMSNSFFSLIKQHDFTLDCSGSHNYSISKTLEIASQKGTYDISQILDISTEKGCLDLVRSYFEVGKLGKSDIIDMPLFYALFYGHLNIVKYFIEIQKEKWDASHLSYALGRGNFGVADIFFENTATSEIKEIVIPDHIDHTENNELMDQFLENYQYIFDSIQLNQYQSYESYTWKDLQQRFDLLIKFGYIDQFKLFLKKYQQNRVNEVNSFSVIYYESIRVSIRFAKLDIVKMLLEEFKFKLSDYVKPSIMMRQASLSGSLEMLLFLDQQSSIDWQLSDYIEAFNKSPINSDLEVVKWLYDKLKPVLRESGSKMQLIDKDSIYELTAKKGKTDIFKWLMESDLKIDNYQDVIQVACSNGNITFLNYLIDNYSNLIDFNEITINFNEIAKNLSSISDLFGIIKWVHQHFNKFIYATDLMDSALKIGCFDSIKWLHENRTEGFTHGGMKSIFKCSLETLNWIKMNRSERFPTEAVDYAGFGSLEKLKWLHENSTNGFTEKAIENAAFANKFDSVKYLQFNQPSLCTHSAISRAARANNLEMVKWIHGNGVEGKRKDTIDYACENNNIEMVKWLNENTTEGVSYISIVHSIINNNFEMFQYLLENVFGKIVHKDRDEPFIFCCNNTSQEAMSNYFFGLMEQHFFTQYASGSHYISNIVEVASEKGCLDLVRSYFEVGKLGKSDSIDMPLFYAALYNHLDIVKYFIEIQKEKWDASHLSYALDMGNFGVVDFFFENTPTSEFNEIVSPVQTDHNDSTNQFFENYQYIFGIK